MTVLAQNPSLYERLPELYRQRDLEQSPPGPLRALVDSMDSVLQALAERVGAQYDDLFIESCEDWLIPYLADLVGSSHLKGDAWTLRADVARTVFHRRRKGTLGAVESQVHALTQWAVHAVELRERLAWNQALNHLRPQPHARTPWREAAGGDPRLPVRGGMAALRSPALLSMVDGPFDPLAGVADLRPPLLQADPPVARPAPNLPHLAVFLWRLADYQTPASRPSPPHARVGQPPWNAVEPAAPGAALYAVRFELHPQGEPLVLFNTHRFQADADSPRLAGRDAVPGPMPHALLNSQGGQPDEYVRINTYTGNSPPLPPDDAVGLLLHLPALPFAGVPWTLRGAELCAWEQGLNPPLAPFEIAIDAHHGRLVFGVTGADTSAMAEPLRAGLRVSATTGFSGLKRREGSVGAQPLPRTPAPLPAGATLIQVDGISVTLADALADLASRSTPLVIEIVNSDTHRLDLAAVSGIGLDPGGLALHLPPPAILPAEADPNERPWPLTLRAASGHRPVIRLVQPLRWRPQTVLGQPAARHALQNVRLQGLYLTRDAAFPAGAALIEQAALNRLEIEGCTLDPGGAWLLDGTRHGSRGPLHPALRLRADLGLSPAEADAFGQTPQIVLRHCISGALAVDRGHLLGLQACIVDAGAGVDEATPALALSSASADPELRWGAPLAFQGLTVFGRSRLEVARGAGGIFVHRLQVHDTQDSHTLEFASRGDGNEGEADLMALLAKPGSCIRESWFRGQGDRLPQHYACLFGTQARLRFGDERFGMPAYAQLALSADRRLREEGPGADEMGAFGFLANSHRWKNASIRLREFMPVGVRALLVPVS